LDNSRQLDYAKVTNSAVAQAKGDLICLLNENLISLHADWLEELIGQAVQPGVGAVGAKLLSTNGTVLHSGLILGIGGVAGFAHHNLANHDQGYFRRAALVQEISAVDGVLMIKKQLFLEAGGFSSGKLGYFYNNVDFCLKLLELGYHNIHTPFAKLMCFNTSHEESEEAIEFMQKKWRYHLLNDCAYNPNLSLEGNTFCLAKKPRLPTFSAP
jgi:GT2 family glycosyltransferase